MNQLTHALDRRLPDARESKCARQLGSILATKLRGGDEIRLPVANKEGNLSEIVLAPALASVLYELLQHVGSGRSVSIIPVNTALTTQQAADILNVSRPYFVRLLDKGVINHFMVGRHRRVKAEEVFKYKESRDAERAEALSEMAKADVDLDLI
jgi:excisionase family DNA binding protein